MYIQLFRSKLIARISLMITCPLLKISYTNQMNAYT